MSAGFVRVLVADDDVALVKTTCDILTAHGHDASGVHTGEEVVERVAREQFHCVLMDVNMPELDGIAALREVRRIAPAVPVLLMTGGASQEQIAAARAHGAYALLAKPVDMEAVLWFLSLLAAPEDLLVIGHDPGLESDLAALLRGTGYRVQAERELASALDRLAGGYKLAVLLDAAGEEGGVDVLGAIRARYPTKPVLLVAAPGGAPPDAVRGGITRGAHAWLERPLRRDATLDCIEDIRWQKLTAVLGDPNEGRSPRASGAVP